MDTQRTASPKFIIFDIGRVLIHYDHQATLAGLAAVSQLNIDKIEALNDPALSAQMGTGELNARQMHQFFVEKAGTTADFNEFVAGYGSGLRRNEEALTYAVSLTERENLQVGVISNTNEAHALWLHANLPELKRFSHVILSNEVGLIKPDPRIYQLSLEGLNAEASHSLFVDDLAENVTAAEALGMAGIVHTDWETSRPQLESWLAQK